MPPGIRAEAIASGDGKNREIYIRPRPEAAAFNQEQRWNAMAKTVVDELLHHSRDKGTFSDNALDTVALRLMNPDDRKTARDEMNGRGYQDGTVGHRLVDQNCRSTNPTGPPPRR